MSYRNERFASSIHSLDLALAGLDPAKATFLSDRGQGVERIIAAADYSPAAAEAEDSAALTERRRRLHAAEVMLHRKGCGYLVPTMMLIVKNGSNRGESIWEMAGKSTDPKPWKAAKKAYFSHRKKILKLLFRPIKSGVR